MKVSVTNKDGIIEVYVSDDKFGFNRSASHKNQIPEIVAMLVGSLKEQQRILAAREKEQAELQEIADKALADLET